MGVEQLSPPGTVASIKPDPAPSDVDKEPPTPQKRGTLSAVAQLFLELGEHLVGLPLSASYSRFIPYRIFFTIRAQHSQKGGCRPR